MTKIDDIEKELESLSRAEKCVCCSESFKTWATRSPA